MSDREWRFYLDDMLSFAKKVMSYTDNLTQSEFESRSLNYDASLRNLELIGEAATHIPIIIREQYTSIPWRQVIATRNQLIHGYLGIDNDTLWSIIQDDIPELIAALQNIRKSEDN